MTRESLHAFIDALALPDDAKARLLALAPSTYIGLARGAREADLGKSGSEMYFGADSPILIHHQACTRVHSALR